MVAGQLADRLGPAGRDLGANGTEVSNGPRGLVDAAAVAEALGVSRGTVYAHADDLGAIRAGGALRFDLAAILTRRNPPAERPGPAPDRQAAPRPARRRRPAAGSILKPRDESREAA